MKIFSFYIPILYGKRLIIFYCTLDKRIGDRIKGIAAIEKCAYRRAKTRKNEKRRKSDKKNEFGNK